MAGGLNVSKLNSGVVSCPKVKWPTMQENSVWAAVDEDVYLPIKNTVSSLPDKSHKVK